MAVWHVDWEGHTYDLDPESITVKQAMVIKASFGWSIKAWLEATEEMDPEAWQAMFWVMKIQSGQACALTDLDFAVPKFAEACGIAAKAATDAENAANQGNGVVPVDQAGALTLNMPA